MMIWRCPTLLSLLLFYSVDQGDACTAMIMGRKATSDGSVLITKSDDGDGQSDPRLAYIPAKDADTNEPRPIWPDLEEYPRYVGSLRGQTYLPELAPGQPLTTPIGYIPQVNHTYAYFEANFGIQNEHQVSIGETTCGAKFKAVALGQPNGTALMSINELSRIALERCTTARDAVQLMGSLGERYGFYGPDGGAGETLMVGDTAEGFVFHMLSDPTGKGAIWVAQRVEDDHFTVAANMFTIRAVNLSDSHRFMGSKNLYSVAQDYGCLNDTTVLDFTKCYSSGEYTHKYYSGRRMWSAFRYIKPSLALPAEYGDLRYDQPNRSWGRSTYPWSVQPDSKIDVKMLFKIHRDHYEGTLYDTTRGLSAGAWGTPDRYATIGAPGDPGTGSWERTIAIYRTTYSYVMQPQPYGGKQDMGLGTLWWGAYDADKTVYVPLMVAMGECPMAHRLGEQSEIDRRSSFWAHRYVGTLTQLKYSKMMPLDVRPLQQSLEQKGISLRQDILAQFAEGHVGLASNDILGLLTNHTDYVRGLFWKLADHLVLKFADGYISNGAAASKDIGVPTGYPKWWLEAVNFTDGPKRLPPPAANAIGPVQY